LSSTKPQYLLDVNALIALIFPDHVHYPIVKPWFNADPNLSWAVCLFTEAGFLRYAVAPHHGQVGMDIATSALEKLAEHPGYHYLPVTVNWRTLCDPFLKRIFGHKQIMDAYLLGLALRENYVLVTLDRAILHLAGEFRNHVLILGQES
jgi:predicted nucleic acid-binding protein